MLVFFVFIIVSVNNYVLNPQSNLITFSTKIQIYLNFAFFVPLVVVSTVIISIISTTNNEDTKANFIDKAQNISTNIFPIIQSYQKEETNIDDLLNKLNEIANVAQSDLHLYDKEGYLLATSQGYMFETDLLYANINPTAYSGILEKRQRTIMLEESVGKLKYNTVYVSIKSFETGDVVGILGIPFFGSKT